MEGNNRLAARHLGTISEGNRAIAHSFLALKHGQGIKSSSRLGIAIALQRLDADSGNKPWDAVNEIDAANLILRMREQGYSDSNLINTASWIKNFLRWSRGSKEFPFRPIEALKVRRSQTLPPRPILTAEEDAQKERLQPQRTTSPHGVYLSGLSS